MDRPPSDVGQAHGLTAGECLAASSDRGPPALLDQLIVTDRRLVAAAIELSALIGAG